MRITSTRLKDLSGNLLKEALKEHVTNVANISNFIPTEAPIFYYNHRIQLSELAFTQLMATFADKVLSNIGCFKDIKSTGFPSDYEFNTKVAMVNALYVFNERHMYEKNRGYLLPASAYASKTDLLQPLFIAELMNAVYRPATTDFIPPAGYIKQDFTVADMDVLIDKLLDGLGTSRVKLKWNTISIDGELYMQPITRLIFSTVKKHFPSFIYGPWDMDAVIAEPVHSPHMSYAFDKNPNSVAKYLTLKVCNPLTHNDVAFGLFYNVDVNTFGTTADNVYRVNGNLIFNTFDIVPSFSFFKHSFLYIGTGLMSSEISSMINVLGAPVYPSKPGGGRGNGGKKRNNGGNNPSNGGNRNGGPNSNGNDSFSSEEFDIEVDEPSGGSPSPPVDTSPKRTTSNLQLLQEFSDSVTKGMAGEAGFRLAKSIDTMSEKAAEKAIEKIYDYINQDKSIKLPSLKLKAASYKRSSSKN